MRNAEVAAEMRLFIRPATRPISGARVPTLRRSLCQAVGIVMGLLAGPAGATGEGLPQRHRAEVVVEQPGAFIRLPLTVQTYARSAPDLHGGLADLRVVDAQGQRVPFALLSPGSATASAVAPAETWRDAAAYRLPPRRAAAGVDADPGLPLELSVERGRITVRPGSGRTAAAAAEPPGWLFDLGEREAGLPGPRTLRLQWTEPAEFTATLRLDVSADLRQWRAAGVGQIVALGSGGAALTQPDVALPPDTPRFVRLLWTGEAPHPRLSGARVATPAPRAPSLEPAETLTVAPSPEPAGAAADARGHAGGGSSGRDASMAPALHFDLGAVLPVTQLALQLAGPRVLPTQVQVRERADERWQPLAATVFYRLDRDGTAVAPPPLTLQRRLRYVRLLPDARAGGSAEGVQLLAQVQVGSVVFAAQGQAPWALLAGAERAELGALPLATLVPDLEQERPRFGRARLGAWSEVAAAAQRARTEALKAQARPWLLWALLLGGVAGLGFMVWRLLRPPQPQQPPPPAPAAPPASP